MLDLRMVDVAISLALIYMMMAGVVSGLQEWLSNLLNLRGRYLMKGIASLLHQRTQSIQVAAVFAPSEAEPRPRVQTDASSAPAPTYVLNVRRIFNAPAIDSLRDGESGKLPSYIPPSTFALVLANHLVKDFLKEADKDKDGRVSAQEVMLALPEAVARMPESRLKTTLQTILSNTERSAGAIQHALEAHYDEVMARVSGWYKRHVQKLAFGIALSVAVGLNVNTLAIINHLNTHPAKAAELADRLERELDRLPAATASAPAGSDATLAQLRQQVDQMQQTRLPMGWQLSQQTLLPPSQWADWFLGQVLSVDAFITLLGWLITAAAATLGAPFWFDMLSRLVSLRSSGKAVLAAGRSGAASSQK